MSDEALRGTSLREVVVETIRDWIVSGVLAPGERLAEAKLARQLEASRAPVREAIQVLSQQGFVELWPGSSPQVAKPSMRDILEYLDVCVALQRMSSFPPRGAQPPGRRPRGHGRRAGRRQEGRGARGPREPRAG